jgi:hypothetical protein
MAVDNTNVYWGNNPRGGPTDDAGIVLSSEVVGCAKTGCGGTPVAIATGLAKDTAGVATDGTNVYISLATAGEVVQCPVAGCGSPIVVAGGQVGPGFIAVDSTGIYWGNAGNVTTTSLMTGSVMTCPLGGCGAGPTTLASDIFPPNAIALDATQVYWLSTYDVSSCPKGGCGGTPVMLAHASASPGIAVDDTNVYWADRGGTKTSTGSLLRCAKQGCGGAPAALVSGQPSPSFVAVDATSLYWLEGYASTQVARCPLPDCAAFSILDGASAATAFTSDATALYWADTAGHIYELVKLP